MYVKRRDTSHLAIISDKKNERELPTNERASNEGGHDKKRVTKGSPFPPPRYVTPGIRNNERSSIQALGALFTLQILAAVSSAPRIFLF